MVSVDPSPNPVDALIIGAGVVGCAVFRELVLAGLTVTLIEQDADILAGASKGNSGLLHTGFDATPGSLELACMQTGYRRHRELEASLNLPFEATGAIVVAWTEEQLAQLPAILAQAQANGVSDARALTAAEVRAREPQLNPSLKGGVLVPGEGVIDPWSTPYAWVLQGLANGGQLQRNCTVLGGRRQAGAWTLDTSQGPLRGRVVFNCAGNYGDLVEAIARPSPFAIRPRKGQFVVYDKAAHGLARSIILPVPTARTKGVVLSRTIFGNLVVGPTAEDQDERRIGTTDTTTLTALMQEGQRILPALAGEAVTAAYAGLRPATQFKEYQIEALPDDHWISVSGIRSTGLTASPGIAAYVAGLYEAYFGPLRPLSDPVATRVPNLAEGLPRPWSQPGRSPLACHCEMVTEAEISAAFAGPLPVGSLGGLKRRCRCMMGRCQGFYCSRRVAQLAAGRLPELPA